MTTPALPPTPEDLGGVDWVMLGVRARDGVHLVYASTDLNYAEMTAIIEHGPPPPAGAVLWPIGSTVRAVDLTVRMVRYVIAEGATYAEALANLMQHWSPDERPRRAPPLMQTTHHQLG